jgi:hypothetical protein
MRQDLASDDLPFMSLSKGVLFPGRVTLYLYEVAVALSCTPEHVANLIEKGELAALDIRSTPTPVKKGRHCAAVRKFWRVPVSGFEQFVKKRSSLNL